MAMAAASVSTDRGAPSTAFRPSPEFEARYELGELLGKGGFGSVYACLDRQTGKKVACKVLNRAHVRRSLGVEASKEVGIMQSLAGEHYGVVQLLDSVEDDLHTYAVMEYCCGKSLLDVLKTHGAMPENSCRVVLGQVAAALAFCHSKRILHLDIKPDNIFFLDTPTDALYGSSFSTNLSLAPLFSSLDVRARLADFGMATVLKQGKKVRGDVGSPHFKAPEIVSGERFGLEVDVWSLGVVLAVMLTGTVPFLGTSNNDKEGLNKAIASGHVNFGSARWWGVSAEARDLVSRMLTVDPAKRITAAEILSHPWFTSGVSPASEPEILPAIAREQAPTAAPKAPATATLRRTPVAFQGLPSTAKASKPVSTSVCKAVRPSIRLPAFQGLKQQPALLAGAPMALTSLYSLAAL